MDNLYLDDFLDGKGIGKFHKDLKLTLAKAAESILKDENRDVKYQDLYQSITAVMDSKSPSMDMVMITLTMLLYNCNVIYWSLEKKRSN